MFSPEIKLQAMLACGRRCCICHRFVGVKIECHHIFPEGKGGANSYENCIPVCFDCHADVGHYNPQHPKGTRFTPEELIGHRDKWYAMHAGGFAPAAPGNYLELDSKLYRRLYDLLGGSRGVLHFRDHDYGATYSKIYEDRVLEFRHLAELPETEFFDTQMAAAFADLCSSLEDYRQATVGRIWRLPHETAGVPPEWLDGQEIHEKRFWDAVTVMNQVAAKVWEAFSQFVKIGRAQLKIDHE